MPFGGFGGFGGAPGGGVPPPQQGGFAGVPQGFGGGGMGFGGAPAQQQQAQQQPAAVGTPMYAGGGGMGGGMGMPSGAAGMPPGSMGLPHGGMGGMGMPPAGGMGAMPMSQAPAMGQGMGAAAAPPMMQQQAATGGGVSEAPLDLACTAGSRAAGWMAAKRHFRSIFEGAGGSPLILPSREVLSAALEAALRDLKAVDALNAQAPDECGLGKLCLQLMSFATVDDPAALVQLFAGLEQVSSPVMTLLLDVPWAATAQSGWPLFALLGTLNMRKGHVPGALNGPEVDGLHDQAGQTLQAELAQALRVGDVMALERAGASFLAKESQGSALAPLTALAVQALGTGEQERVGLLQTLQAAFKQVIATAPELDIALSTNWPLWGLLQLNMDSFATA